MADQFDSNTRSPHPDSEVDDPLAELARIIGYERPSEVAPATEEVSEAVEFDLEAELMHELDVPLAPSADELDSVEADEAVDIMLAESDFDEEPAQSADPVQPEADAPDFDDEPFAGYIDDAPVVEVSDVDEPDSLAAEGRSSDDLLEAIENDYPVDHVSAAPGDDAVIDDDWMMSPDTEELSVASDDAGNEPEFSDTPQDNNRLPESMPAPASASEAVQASDDAYPVDDEVFADMVRFEIPSDRPGVAVESDTSDSDVQTVLDDTTTVNAGAVVTGPEVAGPEMSGPEGADAEAADDAQMDFEEYLSTELDVFGYETALEGSRDDLGVAEASEVEADAQWDVETALDALNESSLDDEAAVFDDAAEELLASIGEGGEGTTESMPEDTVKSGENDSWSLESIEEPSAEELDEELGDMFGLPERVVAAPVETADVLDDLDLDLELEQVLADSFDEADLSETAEAVDTRLETTQTVDTDDWLSTAPELVETDDQDEMTEAFLSLAPTVDGDREQAEAVAVPPVSEAVIEAGREEPGSDDWLGGFETSKHDVESTGPEADDSDYYFDAGLISETDEMVEVVADIDVPELRHDDPQVLEPDYETEIEREFADIVERSEIAADELSTTAADSSFSAADGWSRGSATSHPDEVSDEYIALERELGGSSVEHTRPAVVEGVDATYPAIDFELDEEMAVEDRPIASASRGPVVAIAVLGLALLAGVGALGWSMMSGGETTADGGPRIIRADKDPVKVLPENPGGVTVPNQDKAVYDRVAGGTGSSTGQPALVNSAEEPVDVVQRTLDPEILPLEGRADFSEKSEERLSSDEGAAEVAANEVTAPVVSPRKVRTMIVKPDGSIVAREVSEPEPEVAAVAPQPEAAEQPQNGTQVQPLQRPEPVAQVSAEAATPVEQPSAETETPSAENTVAPTTESAEATATEGTVAPVRVVTTQQIRPVANAPVPQGRPADQPVNVVGTVTQGGSVGTAPAVTAAPQPVAVASAPAAAAPVANPGGYYVQIASQPTVEGAQSSWRTLSSRYSSVLGGQSVDIQRADIPGKGVFHRVRVPAGSRDQANALCSRYKAAGGSCFVSR